MALGTIEPLVGLIDPAAEQRLDRHVTRHLILHSLALEQARQGDDAKPHTHSDDAEFRLAVRQL